MLEMLRDLIAHKGHANAALLTAIQQNPTAASDPEQWELVTYRVPFENLEPVRPASTSRWSTSTPRATVGTSL